MQEFRNIKKKIKLPPYLKTLSKLSSRIMPVRQGERLEHLEEWRVEGGCFGGSQCTYAAKTRSCHRTYTGKKSLVPGLDQRGGGCRLAPGFAEQSLAWKNGSLSGSRCSDAKLCNAKLCLCWWLTGSPFIVVPLQH